MNKIKILPDIVANKIAAGEVVERPASVVKELVENAIDAGATAVAVETEQGGSRLIRVSDNGCGMTRDDALLSLERHATSKIADVRDIENIITLGFRGEALPSIVSVAKALIETRSAEEQLGTRLVIDGGVLKQVTDTGRNPGTDVEIRHLFFNLPARRKFMKSEATELRHIRQVLYEAAIADPALAVTFISESREQFSFRSCTDRHQRLEQILGETLGSSMVPLETEIDEVRVSGFLGRPDAASTGLNQFLVVNGRPVHSKTISRAVIQGYGASLPHDSYPAYVLYLELDPHRVDVNIHPTKREIRILREYTLLQGLTEEATRTFQTLRSAPQVTPPVRPFADYTRGGEPIAVYAPPAMTVREESNSMTVPAEYGLSFPQETLPFGTEPMPASHARETVPLLSLISPPSRPVFDGPTFMQVANMYILTTIKEGALIIDQHVAHERILYEEILANLKGHPAAAQQLLFPVTLDFSAAEYDLLGPMLPHLNTIGFGIREFGERAVMIDAIPAGVEEFADGRLIYEFIEEMRKFGHLSSGYLDKLAASIACRAAIKAGKPLGQQEMQYLVDRLFACDKPFTCPHGRPTIVKLTLPELDRRFGR
jgi:DNA mismatch repair protein MutL